MNLNSNDREMKEKIKEMKRLIKEKIKEQIKEDERRIPTKKEVEKIFRERMKEYTRTLKKADKGLATGGPIALKF